MWHVPRTLWDPCSPRARAVTLDAAVALARPLALRSRLQKSGPAIMSSPSHKKTMFSRKILVFGTIPTHQVQKSTVDLPRSPRLGQLERRHGQALSIRPGG